MKIAIVGAGGQGKTALVKRIVSDLKVLSKDATEVVEYARSYIDECEAPENPWEQLEIIEEQLKRERQAQESYEIVVCDIAVWIAAVYASFLTDFKNPKHIHVLKRIMNTAIETCHSYDYIFYLPKIFMVMPDKTRTKWFKQYSKKVEELDSGIVSTDEMILSFMTLFKINYIEVDAVDIKERSDFIISHLSFTSIHNDFSDLGKEENNEQV